MTDAVESQLEAYNAHDVSAFVECHSTTVTIEDAVGTVRVRGRDQLRDMYSSFFERAPDVRAEVLHRARVGAYVVDEERITGGPAGEQHAVAVYRIDDGGLISQVRLLS